MCENDLKNEKLKYYNQGREVPANAKRKITDGRLKGKTDINPMWRIKKLTEMFGVVGIGWRVEIRDIKLHELEGETLISMFIDLFYRTESGTWSEPLVGIGGAKLTSYENKRNYQTNEYEKVLYKDDDAFKKAYSDALSVACKSLGIGADVYFEGDSMSKYITNPVESPAPANYPPASQKRASVKKSAPIASQEPAPKVQESPTVPEPVKTNPINSQGVPFPEAVKNENTKLTPEEQLKVSRKAASDFVVNVNNKLITLSQLRKADINLYNQVIRETTSEELKRAGKILDDWVSEFQSGK